MPALLSIDACIVVRGVKPIGFHGAYRDPSSVCEVWIRDSYAGVENCWHQYYADQIIDLLNDLAKINFSIDERDEMIGAVRHTSQREHSVTLTGHSVPRIGVDWEISLGSFWDNFPFLEAAENLKRLSKSIEPNQIIPIHPVNNPLALAQQLQEYRARWQDNLNRPTHVYLPIHINRPEEK